MYIIEKKGRKESMVNNSNLIYKTEKILQTKKGKNFENLYKLLSQSTPRSSDLTFEYIESYPQPKLENQKIRFNYTLSELNQIANNYEDFSEENILDFYLLALSICGIKIKDSKALSFINAPSEKSNRYLRVIATINNKPFTMRVVPNRWGDETSPLTTNFYLKGSSIYLGEQKLCTITSWCNLCSINNIAYISKNIHNENILCVNPIQFCNQECKFCLRTQEIYSSNKTDELIYLKSDQLCRYIQSELPDINYSTLNEFYISTGRFSTTKSLLNYLKNLQLNLKKISNNTFDPTRIKNQWIKVSTHLLDTTDAMNEAYSYGVKKYLYPIEIVCDKKRKQYMTSKNLKNNKGDVSFKEIISILDAASKVFGKENIEPVLIIGIDSYEDTLNALHVLKQEGYTTLSYNIYRAYYEEQLNLYNMSFEEIIDITNFIKNNFNQGYKQIVDMNNKYVKKSYIPV